jgi:hypothetical protein
LDLFEFLFLFELQLDDLVALHLLFLQFYGLVVLCFDQFKSLLLLLDQLVVFLAHKLLILVNIPLLCTFQSHSFLPQVLRHLLKRLRKIFGVRHIETGGFRGVVSLE